MTSSAATTADVQPARTAGEIVDEFFALPTPTQPDPNAPWGGEARNAYYRACSARATRQRDLLVEAAGLPVMPQSIAHWLVGWVSSNLADHAREMASYVEGGEV